MYLANKELRKDYLKYLQIARKANLIDYIIDNNLDYAAFFYSVMKKNDIRYSDTLDKVFKVIKTSWYYLQYITYVKDNPVSRKIILETGSLDEQFHLSMIDNHLSSTLEQRLLDNKSYKLLFLAVQHQLVNNQKVANCLLKSNKSKYMFAGAKISKKNLQMFVDKLISRHKKTYIFAMMKKYPNLDYSKYENYLIKHNLIKEINIYLSLKSSEKLENYLILI